MGKRRILVRGVTTSTSDKNTMHFGFRDRIPKKVDDENNEIEYKTDKNDQSSSGSCQSSGSDLALTDISRNFAFRVRITTDKTKLNFSKP